MPDRPSATKLTLSQEEGCDVEGLNHLTLCQRVQRGGEWVDMGRVIRELRTFELDTVPQLTA